MNMYKNRNQGGTDVSKFSCLNVPELKPYKPTEGKIKNRINILQFKVGSKNHPLVSSGDLKIGDLDWQLNWFEHRNVGPQQRAYVCLKRTYGKPCVACEARETLRRNGVSKDAPEMKALTATERSAFLVQSVSPEGVSEVSVFNVSTFLFTTKLLATSTEDDMAEQYDGGQVEFAEFGKLGRTVVFKYNTTGEGTAKRVTYDNITFAMREEKNMIPSASMIEDLPSLDLFLKVCTPAEFSTAFNAEESAEDDNEDAALPVQKTKPPVTKKAKEDDENPHVISSDPNEEVKKPDNADRSFSESICPNGYKFGVNCDCYAKCASCKIYEDCAKASI